jgi:hypothetical protein
MLSLRDQGTVLCDGLTRREWLRVGALGMAGLTLPTLLRTRQAEAASAAHGRTGKAKACIVLFFLGGPPQHETWDPKPNAPAEVRGDLKPIASSVPGVHVGELMPKTAKLLNKICVLRGVTTDDNAHSSSGYYMTTGYPHQPVGAENAKPGAPNDWPCLGTLVNRMVPGGGLPAAVTLPEQSANDGNLTWPGQDAGFLGRTADPWLINCDPSAPNFHVDGLALPAEVSAARFEARRSLVQQVNRDFDALARSDKAAVFDAQQQRALDLITGAQTRRAFNLHEEPVALRERYGPTKFGQSVLLARRLIEAGVSLVRVNWSRVPKALNNGHWDTHSQNTNGLKQLMPIMDQTYSALLEDLAQRGLLDETLVVWTGEFGRTPKINGAAGRDHWGRVFSVALAGGGVKGGMVHGASDSIAAYPKDGRVTPPDLLATIFHCLGIRPDAEIHDSQGRPIPLTRGEVIRQIV